MTLASCASYEVAEFRTHITLPASGDGYGINVITKERVRYPKAQWDQMKKKGIILLSEDYAKLKKSILKNCHMNQCKQIVGTLDTLFQNIDDALRIIDRSR